MTLNELVYDPIPVDGASAGALEWVELFNAGDTDVPLGGWTLADNRGTDVLPPATLPARGFLVVAASGAFQQAYPDYRGPLIVLSGTLGNGLSNESDHLILRDAAGRMVDALSYGADRSVFDPPLPPVEPGHSLERRSPGRSGGGAADFADNYRPTPGAAWTPPSPLPPGTLVLSELVYNPLPLEGYGDSELEWLEVYNRSGRPVSLDGCTVGDGVRRDYLPPLIVPPRGYVVIAASAAFGAAHPDYGGPLLVLGGRLGNGLSNDGDRLFLRGPDGAVLDALSYGDDASVFDPPLPRLREGHAYARSDPDRPTGRAADFFDSARPTPGRPPPPPVVPPPPGPAVSPLDQVRDRILSVAAARRLPDREKAIVVARLTDLPNLTLARKVHVQDASGALSVYLERGSFPPLAIGDRLLLTGVLGQRFGERELRVFNRWDMVVLDHAGPPAPLAVATGEVGAATESRLVTVAGRITRLTRDELDLDDGSGRARVLLRAAARVDTSPYRVGDWVAVTGIVSQQNGVFRLFPRRPSDLRRALATGEEVPSQEIIIPLRLP